MPNLVSGDQVVITVTYSVDSYVVSTKVYIWTLYIPTPELTAAHTDPGEAAPAFESGVYLYDLTLPVGTESTSYTLSNGFEDARAAGRRRCDRCSRVERRRALFRRACQQRPDALEQPLVRNKV